jgi:hypothetical protein
MFAALAVVLCLPSAAFAKITNDPRYADQQALWDQINVPNAWELTTGSRAVTVAVIDTGFDTEHEDLRANTWTNTRETPNNGIDDDGNGYVDDVHGWNFVEDNNTTRTPITSAADSVDAINHGSLVAGLIGAVGDNGLDGTGLNWNVSLMPLRAISNNGSGTTGNVIKFITIVGRKPDHIDTHKRHTTDEGIESVLREYSKSNNIPVRNFGVKHIGSSGINTGDPSIGQLKKSVDEAAEQYNELMTHCGYSDDNLREHSSYSEPREQELEAICDPAIKSYIAQKELVLCNWRTVSAKPDIV